MGSGYWLKNMINLNKARKPKSKKMKGSSIPISNGFILEPQAREESTNTIHDVAYKKPVDVGPLTEDIAATRIQTTFKAFMARKAFRHMKGASRLKTLVQSNFGKKQTSNTLVHLHSWSKIQSHIRIRRVHMVEEGGIRQKKLENQMKLEAKLHDLEVEWSGGSHTKDEALARIQQREEAALKRERAMAYAFSHQWRANSRSNLGPNDSELATANWGWSWTDRWIAARPWESRVESTVKKVKSPANKTGENSKSPSTKNFHSLKTSPKGKKTVRNRKLSYGVPMKAEDSNIMTKKLVTK